MPINVTVSGGTTIVASVDGEDSGSLSISDPVNVSQDVVVEGGIGPAAFIDTAASTIIGAFPFQGGPGITISTASGSLSINGRTDSQVVGLAPVQSVNGKSGTVSLTVADITAAPAVHTHGTSDITGLTARIQEFATVSSVNGHTGTVSLTVQDLTAAPQIHTHSTASIANFSQSIQALRRTDTEVAELAPVQKVNSQTGNVSLTVADLTAAPEVHTHGTTDITGLTQTIQQYGKVLSVNGYTGTVNLTVQDLTAVNSVNGYTGTVSLTVADLTAAPATHTHSTANITGLTATIQEYGKVVSVNEQTGTVTLTVADLTAAPEVHTHGTTDITGLTQTIQQYGKVLSVNGHTGTVSLTVADLTAAAETHTHSTTDITGLTATIQEYGKVVSVNGYTGTVTLTVQDITAAPAIHTHSRTSVTDLTQSDISFSPNRVLFSNVYPTLSDLPSATDNHGMFAHVHAEGRGYFAHAGAWISLANESELGSVNGMPVVDLVAGDGINISTAAASGTNSPQIQISHTVLDKPDSLNAVQGLDGDVHLHWLPGPEQSSGYMIQIGDVNMLLATPVVQSSTFNSDGSLTLTLRVDDDTENQAVEFSLDNGQSWST